MNERLIAVLLGLFVIGVALDTSTCVEDLDNNSLSQSQELSNEYTYKISDECFLSHFQSIELEKDGKTYPLEPFKIREGLGRKELSYGSYLIKLKDHFDAFYYDTFWLNYNIIADKSDLIVPILDDEQVIKTDLNYLNLTIFYTDWNYGECISKSFKLSQKLTDCYVNTYEIDKDGKEIRNKYKIDKAKLLNKLTILEKQLSEYETARKNSNEYVEYFVSADFIINRKMKTYEFGKESIGFLNKMEIAIQESIIEVI